MVLRISAIVEMLMKYHQDNQVFCSYSLVTATIVTCLEHEFNFKVLCCKLCYISSKHEFYIKFKDQLYCFCILKFLD